MRRHRHQMGSPFIVVLIFVLLFLLIYSIAKPKTQPVGMSDNLRPVLLDEAPEELDISLKEKPDVEKINTIVCQCVTTTR